MKNSCHMLILSRQSGLKLLSLWHQCTHCDTKINFLSASRIYQDLRDICVRWHTWTLFESHRNQLLAAHICRVNCLVAGWGQLRGCGLDLAWLDSLWIRTKCCSQWLNVRECSSDSTMSECTESSVTRKMSIRQTRSNSSIKKAGVSLLELRCSHQPEGIKSIVACSSQ